jgi:hypothetical protein
VPPPEDRKSGSLNSQRGPIPIDTSASSRVATELVAPAIGAVVSTAVGFVWAGARLALVLSGADRPVAPGATAIAVSQLLGHLPDPAAAWPELRSGLLPGPFLSWSFTAFTAVDRPQTRPDTLGGVVAVFGRRDFGVQ